MGRFVEMCRRRGLKVKAKNTKVMVLNGEDGLEFEVRVDGMRLEHVSESKYFGCILYQSGTDNAECRKKVASRREESCRCYEVPG